MIDNTDNATDYCQETWTIATQTASATTTFAERCTRMQVKMDRLFITGDNPATPASSGNDSYDIDLDYRKYSMTTGWLWQKAAADESTAPGLIHFDPIEVDFDIFRNAEVTYTGAMDGFIYTGAGIVAGVLAMTF